jgi:hypothetical protein
MSHFQEFGQPVFPCVCESHDCDEVVCSCDHSPDHHEQRIDQRIDWSSWTSGRIRCQAEQPVKWSVPLRHAIASAPGFLQRINSPHMGRCSLFEIAQCVAIALVSTPVAVGSCPPHVPSSVSRLPGTCSRQSARTSSMWVTCSHRDDAWKVRHVFHR